MTLSSQKPESFLDEFHQMMTHTQMAGGGGFFERYAASPAAAASS